MSLIFHWPVIYMAKSLGIDKLGRERY